MILTIFINNPHFAFKTIGHGLVVRCYLPIGFNTAFAIATDASTLTATAFTIDAIPFIFLNFQSRYGRR